MRPSGRQTAKQAVAILKEGKKPADMPIEYLANGDLYVNMENAQAIGITIPEEIAAQLK